MMTRIPALLLLCCATVTTMAAERGDHDIGLHYSHLVVDRGDLKRGNPGAVVASVGHRLSPLYVLEGRAGTGLHSECCFGVRLQSELLLGSYLRAELPAPDAIQPYVLAGYSVSRIRIEDTRQRDDGFSYGGGVEFAIGHGMDVRMEYARLLDNDYGRQDAISAGLRYRF